MTLRHKVTQLSARESQAQDKEPSRLAPYFSARPGFPLSFFSSRSGIGQRSSSKVPVLFQDFLLLPELTAAYLGLCLGCSWGVEDRLEMLLLAWVAFWCLPLKRANSFLSYYFIFTNSRVSPYIFSMLCSLHMYCPLYQK